MDNREQMNPITTEVVCKAVMGVAIENNREMLIKTYGNKVPPECLTAREMLRANPAKFKEWLQNWLLDYPRIKEFFGDILAVRLTQDGILRCPIFLAICDDSQNLERRLERVRCVPGIEEIKKEYRAGGNSGATDLAILNLTTEILILDLMLQSGFDVRKLPKQKRAHIDIAAQRGEKHYAIEVTRKKEVETWAHAPYGNLEDPDNPVNQNKIGDLLWNTLTEKNGQFFRALAAGNIDRSAIKVVAIRTDDFGFTECIDQAQQIAHDLLALKDSLNYVDCVWLVPKSDVDHSRWICKCSVSGMQNIKE